MTTIQPTPESSKEARAATTTNNKSHKKVGSAAGGRQSAIPHAQQHNGAKSIAVYLREGRVTTRCDISDTHIISPVYA